MKEKIFTPKDGAAQKNYQKAEFQLIEFDLADIITSSGEEGSDDRPGCGEGFGFEGED